MQSTCKVREDDFLGDNAFRDVSKHIWFSFNIVYFAVEKRRERKLTEGATQEKSSLVKGPQPLNLLRKLFLQKFPFDHLLVVPFPLEIEHLEVGCGAVRFGSSLKGVE